MADPKAWYTSKTIWLQMLVLAATIVDYFARTQDVEFSLDAASLEHIAIALAAVGGIVVRFRTNRPVTAKRPKHPDTENLGDA